jgi:hypothetical protein
MNAIRRFQMTIDSIYLNIVAFLIIAGQAEMFNRIMADLCFYCG